MTTAATDSYSALKSLLCSTPAPCGSSSNYKLLPNVNFDLHQEEAIDFSTTSSKVRGSYETAINGFDVSSSTDFSTTANGSHIVASKKKAAFDLWHKRKLSELEESGHDGSSKNDGRNLLTDDSQRSVIFRSRGPIGQRTSNLQHLLGFKPNQAKETDVRKSRTLIKNVQSVDIISPKLSRHNDAAFYPNIQCVLCKEWVCSRNRYMHIESHLQYRPYKCSVCQYDNRKKIFIELHINKVHKGHQDAQVVYNPDTELEKKAWALAEQCLQHTREVLLRKDERSIADSTSWTNENGGTDSVAVKETTSPPETTSPSDMTPRHNNLIETYEDVFRPNIYNSQRRGKSLLIEKSRQLGLMPDLTEVMDREEKCRLCSGYVLRTHNLIEEHVRAHLPQPSYACSFGQCSVSHNSKNFIFRHMKEVHRARQAVIDLLSNGQQETENQTLQSEFNRLCQNCFPIYFSDRSLQLLNNGTTNNNSSNVRKKSPSNANTSTVLSVAIDLSSSKRVKSFGENTLSSSNNHRRLNTVSSADTTCLGCELGFSLFFTDKNGSLSIVAGGNQEERSSSEARECIQCKISSLEADGEKSSSSSFSPIMSDLYGFGRLFCSICEKFISGHNTVAQWHALKHCQPDPFACSFCENFSTADLRSMFSHVHKNHSKMSGSLNINKIDETRVVQFLWSTLDWRKMWREMFQICFSSNATPSSGNLHKEQCALCSTPVAGDYRVLIEHSSKHMHRQCYSCFYCQDSNNGSHPLAILSHLTENHPDLSPVLCMDTSKESLDERNLLLMLCFPKVDVPEYLS